MDGRSASEGEGTAQAREADPSGATPALRSDDAGLLAAIFARAPVGLLIVDAADRRIRALSRHGLELLGLGPSRYDPQRALEASVLTAPADASALARVAPFVRALDGESFEGVPWSLRKPDGEVVHLVASGAPVLDAAGRVTSALVTFVEAVDPAAAARAEAQLAAIVASTHDAVVGTDMHGIVQTWNPGAERIFGYEAFEAIGAPITFIAPLHHIDDMARALERIRRGERIEQLETERVAKDGTRRTVSLNASPVRDSAGQVVGVVAVARDLTERKRAEEAMLEAQRLSSLGLLAGGVAHDFNTILTAIMGNLEIARLHAMDEGVVEALTLAERALDEARDLARQLLAFSRCGAQAVKTVSIAGLLADTVRFALRGSNVRAGFRIEGDLWPAKVDEAQLGQAIHAVVHHARLAMAEGGELAVSAKNVLLAEENACRLPPADYLRVAFESDDDTYTPEGDVTTGHAGGFDLAAAQTIVRGLGGRLVIEAGAGEGTAVFVYLPASTEPEQAPEPRAEGRVEPKGAILLMDDDAAVREVGGALLARLGFEVRLAADGGDALRIYRDALERGRPFTAVILDLTVPGGMGGIECLRGLKAIDPHVRALVSSGYSSDLVMSEHEEYGFEGVVPKPYRLADLSNALASVLGGR